MNFSKTVTPNQINIWHDVLVDLLEKDEELANMVIQKVRKKYKPLDYLFKRNEDLKILKKYSLEKEYINTLKAFDISEALEISEQEACIKLCDYKFTPYEEDVIINTFKGGIDSFLQKTKGEINAR